ncbi:restriction endonuclease fold toxin-2 domain-containing protein [Streptomyces vinaceus]|uniref:restriction endonuclease fold toxin-2 domain-containing protein n=1 Tax=Streptomyces vinaceus TaxID=1960 RepID=UPI0038141053
MGRHIQGTAPSGLCSEWLHDPAGRPTRLSSANGTIAFAYDDAGREYERRIGYEHDAAGRLIRKLLNGQTHTWNAAAALRGPCNAEMRGVEVDTNKPDSVSYWRVMMARVRGQGLRPLRLLIRFSMPRSNPREPVRPRPTPHDVRLRTH